MNYQNIVKAIFIERLNRFIALCEINNETVTVHVKNTGRCRELLIKGTTVYLEYFPNTTRKTSYDLITVVKNNRLINMDSQVPNKVIYEELSKGNDILNIGKPLTRIKPETIFKKSRFDIYAECENAKIFAEIKGVTLEENNIALFPDAPTERGLKHISELIEAKEQGYDTFIIFLIQMENISHFSPNYKTHAEFGNALKNAESSGVKILAFDSIITEESIVLNKPVNVIL